MPTTTHSPVSTTVRPAITSEGGSAVLRRVVVTSIWILLLFREYSNPEGPYSPLYDKALGQFRWIDLLVISAAYVHLAVILVARRTIPRLPAMVRYPLWLFFGALAVALGRGALAGGSELFYEWRNIVLGIGLAIVWSYWITSVAALQEAIVSFSVVMGAKIFYALGSYALAGGLMGAAVPGVATPIFDGPTLSAVTLAALLGLRSLSQNGSGARTWWGVLGVGASFLIVLSLRRSCWVALALGVAVTMAFRPRRLILAGSLLVLTVVVAAVSLQGSLLRRMESFSVFADRSEYGQTNQDHIGELLDVVEQIEAHPVLGIGVGTPIKTDRIRNWKKESWEVHNAILFMWLRFGFAGLVAYLGFHAGLLRWLWTLQHSSRSEPIRTLCQVSIGFVLGHLVNGFVFSPWPYGQFQNMVLFSFIIGSLMRLDSHAPRVPA